MAESNEKNVRVQQREVQIQGIPGVVINLSEFPLPYVEEEDNDSTCHTELFCGTLGHNPGKALRAASNTC